MEAFFAIWFNIPTSNILYSNDHPKAIKVASFHNSIMGIVKIIETCRNLFSMASVKERTRHFKKFEKNLMLQKN